MTLDEAGRLQETWKAKKRKNPWLHRRMVEYLYDEEGKTTGNLVCRECGGIFHNPLKNLD